MSVTIPKKLWRIHNEREGQENLVYMTNHATDSAFEKRKATGLHWARRCIADDMFKLPEVTFENEPLPGFKLLKNVTRWSTSNVVWRVQDPRGFELEIYSGNLMEILQCSKIENGVIMDACVWGREDGKNILLPLSSEPYVAAFKNTTMINNPISWDMVWAGDKIELTNGVIGIYIGKYYVGYVDFYEPGKVEMLSSKQHILEIEEGKYLRGDKLMPFKILRPNNHTSAESLYDIVNIALTKEKVVFDGGARGGYRSRPFLSTKKDAPNLIWNASELDVSDSSMLRYDGVFVIKDETTDTFHVKFDLNQNEIHGIIPKGNCNDLENFRDVLESGKAPKFSPYRHQYSYYNSDVRTPRKFIMGNRKIYKIGVTVNGI